MQKIISKEVDYVSEAIILLEWMAQEHSSIGEVEKNITGTSGEAMEDLQRLFGLLRQMVKDAEKQFRRKKDKISFYFQSGKNWEETNSTLVLLSSEMKVFSGKSASEVWKELEELSEEEVCRKFSLQMLRVAGNGLYDNEMNETGDAAEIMRRILKLQISSEKKLIFQDLFWNREEHRKQTFELIEETVDFLQGYREELEAEAARFYEHWSGFLVDGHVFSQYVKEYFRIDIGEENPYGFEVWPCILGINRCSYTSDMDENGKFRSPEIVHLGSAETYGAYMKGWKFTPELENKHVLEVLKVLSDKSKFEILSYIRDKRAYGSELAKHMGLTTATISHHMGALFDCGLVEIERENNRMFYREKKETMEQVLEYCRKTLL